MRAEELEQHLYGLGGGRRMDQKFRIGKNEYIVVESRKRNAAALENIINKIANGDVDYDEEFHRPFVKVLQDEVKLFCTKHEVWGAFDGLEIGRAVDSWENVHYVKNNDGGWEAIRNLIGGTDWNLTKGTMDIYLLSIDTVWERIALDDKLRKKFIKWLQYGD